MAAKDFKELLDEFGSFNEQFVTDFAEGLREEDARKFGVFVVSAEIQKQLQSSIEGMATAGINLSERGSFIQSEILELSQRAFDANTEQAREIRKDLAGMLSLTKQLADSERKALEGMVSTAQASLEPVSDFGDILIEGLMDSLPTWMSDSAAAAEKFLPGFLGKIAGNTIRAGRRRQQDEAVRAERFRRLGSFGGGASGEQQELPFGTSAPEVPTTVVATGGDERVYEKLCEIRDKICMIHDIMKPKGVATGTGKLKAKEAELEAGRANAEATGEAVSDSMTTAAAGGMGLLGTAATETFGEIAGNVLTKYIPGGKGKGGAGAPAPSGPAPKPSKLGKMSAYAGAFATAAQGLLLLAGALVVFNFVEWESIGKAAVALPIFLGIMALAVKVMPKDKDLIKFGKSSALLAGALAILAVGLVVMNFVEWESLLKAGASLVIMLGIMWAATKAMPPKTDLIKFAMSAAILGIALMTLAGGFLLMQHAGIEGMLKSAAAILTLVGIAALIGKIASKSMSDLIKFSAAMAILGAGVGILGLSMNAFNELGVDSMAKAMTSILALVGMAALVGKISSKAFKDIAIFAAAMPILSIGVAALGWALGQFEGVSMGAVGVLAATLIVLGIAVAAFAAAIMTGVGGLLILGAIGLLAALGVALIPFGYAAKLAGEGMKMLGEGFHYMYSGIALIVGAVGDFLLGMFDKFVGLAKVAPQLYLAAGGVLALGAALAVFMAASGAGGFIGGILGGIGSLFGGDSANPIAVMAAIGMFAERARGLGQIVTEVDQLRYALQNFAEADIDMDSLEEVATAFDRFDAESGLSGLFGMGAFSEFETLITGVDALKETAAALNVLGPSMRKFAEATMGEDFFEAGWFSESAFENLMENLAEGISEIDEDKTDAVGEALFKLARGLEILSRLNLATLQYNIKQVPTLLKSVDTATADVEPISDEVIEATQTKTTPMHAAAAEGMPTTVTTETQQGPQPRQTRTTTTKNTEDFQKEVTELAENLPEGESTLYTMGRTDYQITKTTGGGFTVDIVGRRNRNRSMAAQSGRSFDDMRAKQMLSMLTGKSTLGGVTAKTKVHKDPEKAGYWRPTTTASWDPQREKDAFELAEQFNRVQGSKGGAGVTGTPATPVTADDFIWEDENRGVMGDVSTEVGHAVESNRRLNQEIRLSRTMGSPTALTPEGELALTSMANNATLKSEQTLAARGGGDTGIVIAPKTNATVNNNQTVAMANMGVRNNESSFNASQIAQYTNSSKG